MCMLSSFMAGPLMNNSACFFTVYFFLQEKTKYEQNVLIDLNYVFNLHVH